MSNRQTYFPGTEPPDVVQVSAIDDAIDAWHEAQRQRRDAAEAVKIKHLTLLELLNEHKLERYPYVDAKTGKKREIVIAREPKAKSQRQSKSQQADAGEDDWNNVGVEVTVTDQEQSTPLNSDDPPVDNVVEMRRVKRNAEHDAVIDPFASTRAAIEASEELDAIGGTTVDTPKKRKGKR